MAQPMTDKQPKVSDDTVVSLDYTLRLDDGEVVDTSEEGQPLEFLQGHGQIISGLEQALYGMSVGEEKEVVVEPADGYGEFNPEAYQQVPLSAFPTGVELEPGMGLELMSQDGQPLLAFIAEIGDDQVLLDLNHPLAGETLYFKVRIADLRAATDEEVAHGHAHGAHTGH